MSRVLHGMPLNTLPDPGELQTGDQIVAYREDTGKAYRSNIAGLGAAANQNISDAFSTAKLYSVGDYCIYNDVLYKFTADKGIGDWDESVVEQTTVTDEFANMPDKETFDDTIAELNERISELESKTKTILENSSSSQLYLGIDSNGYAGINAQESSGNFVRLQWNQNGHIQLVKYVNGAASKSKSISSSF